jgi:hypothetical protein
MVKARGDLVSSFWWLFQVNMPFLVSQSTNLRSLMVSLKQFESKSRRFKYPYFSEREEVILKSPSRI